MRGLDELFAHRNRAFPGNIQGGGILHQVGQGHINRPRDCKHLQSKDETRTRFGALHFGVGVLDTADPWTRMSYDGSKPTGRSPLSDPYEAYRKLYGNVREKKQVRSVLDDLQVRPESSSGPVLSASDRKLLIEHTKLVERMDKEYTGGSSLNNLVSAPH